MTKRFAATETALQRCPLAPEAVSEIYSSFLQTGALPNDRRLSWAVLERALHARKASADTRASSISLSATSQCEKFVTAVGFSTIDFEWKNCVR